MSKRKKRRIGCGGGIVVSALKLGKRGKKVEKLQEKLRSLGYDPGEIDGWFGYKTLESVSELRHDLHLPPTGEVNRQVYACLKTRKRFGSSYERSEDGLLERTFMPKIGSFGQLNGADFELSLLDNDRTKIKVLKLEGAAFLTTQLVKIRKHPFYIAFHTFKGQKKAQVLALGRKAEGFVYLPWKTRPVLNEPIIGRDTEENLQSLIKELYWKDLYLGIPLVAFEWLIEPEDASGNVRYSDLSIDYLDSGVVKEGYPKEVPYDEAIGYLRKRGKRGRKIQGDLLFQYRRKHATTIIKFISPDEIQRLLDLCDRYRLTGVVFWGATLGEDRLEKLKIPKQL